MIAYFLDFTSLKTIRLSRPTDANSISFTVENERSVAGARCASGEDHHNFILFVSHKLTAPLSQATPSKEVLK